MQSNKVNARDVALSESLFYSTVTPPLPPLPPTDIYLSPRSLRKAAILVPGRAEAGPNDLSIKSRRTPSLEDVDLKSIEIEKNSLLPPSVATMSAPKLFQEHQQFPDFEVNKSRIADEKGFEQLKARKEDIHGHCCSSSTTTEYGRTIWSVTPEELTEMAKEMTEKESSDSSKTLSYAEASKRNVPGFALKRPEKKAQGVIIAHPIRTFKKYYGLPNITSVGSLNRQQSLHHSDINDAKSSERKAMPLEQICCTQAENMSQNMLDYSHSFGLSPTMATLYPHQTSDKNELIQMV
ncbi:hypothetical protein PsorP6_001279 [Peronosclerospora sorghi]|uniref:Uncharacterized protein n=1 Tax=Peronosclerospora sorghi TaxID=230839 RepID=A0ACC0WWU7_9STRA|nr:hypothetical protein PsorP6_001279 [Peronosclerospora sorghi]